MADNTRLSIGTLDGDTYASDDIAGIKHQRVKLEWGIDGTVNEVDDVSGKRLPISAAQLPTALGGLGGLKIEELYSGLVTLQASQTSATTVTTTTRTITTGLGNFVDGVVLIVLTGAGSGTGVLNLYLQDNVDGGGSNWNDLISSVTFNFGTALTSSNSTQHFCISQRLATSQAQGSAIQQETLTAGTIRLGPWGDRLRVREKVSGVTGTPTGVTYAIFGAFKR